jgi:hypothetical protein
MPTSLSPRLCTRLLRLLWSLPVQSSCSGIMGVASEASQSALWPQPCRRDACRIFKLHVSQRATVQSCIPRARPFTRNLLLPEIVVSGVRLSCCCSARRCGAPNVGLDDARASGTSGVPNCFWFQIELQPTGRSVPIHDDQPRCNQWICRPCPRMLRRMSKRMSIR